MIVCLSLVLHSCSDEHGSVSGSTDTPVYSDADRQGQSPDPDADTNSSEDAGGSLGFDELAYRPPGTCTSNGCQVDDCRILVDVCWFVSQASDFLGLVEVVHVGTRGEPQTCGEEEFSSAYVNATVRVLQGSVFGEGPQNAEVIETFFLTKGSREFEFVSGDLLLVGMRKSKENCFGLGYVYVEDGAVTSTQDNCEYRIDLPETFAELVSAAKAARIDFQQECPDLASYRRSDEEFEDWAYGGICP
jgi:hypothetical protein